ncbi:ATP-binding protein [Streptomyces bullii]|uniref:ATP-binding protein n=1 Tax=Streptomyces bullii TaxID=349910 RepID=A0ABW0UXJ6_9ACTN
MVIPLEQQAADEQGTDEYAMLCYAAAWADGAARAFDARQALHAFLAHAPLADRTTPGPAPLVPDSEIVVSELVTNAIRHAPGPCGLLLRLSGDELAITVWDTSTDEPTVEESDRRRVGGHGLHLVHTVSDRVVVTLHDARKQITAYLRLAPDDDIGAVHREAPSSSLS